MTVRKIKREFMKQAKIGNGRAYFIFKENPKIDFTKQIVDLAVHNYGFDPQIEGDRADYALQFIRELEEKQRQKVFAEIKKQLLEIKIDWDWDVDQLFKIAALLSKEYDSEFGEILRKRFDTCSRDELWQFPKDSILMLDGFDGMVRLAHRIGKILLSGDEWYEDDSNMCCVPGMKRDEVKEQLTELSKNDSDIKAYLDAVNKDEARKPSETWERYKTHAFEVAKEAIANKKMVPWRACMNLSHEEVCYFADEFKKARTQKEKLLYLDIFSVKHSRYPYSEQDLIDEFSLRKNSWFNERLVDCLDYFSSDKIRAIAQKALDSDQYSYFYLQLLINNYREGDAVKIVRKIKRTKDEVKFHYAVGTVQCIYEKNITKECLEPLLLAYKTRCGHCRHGIVEIMETADVLSKEIRAEFQHDSAYLYDKRVSKE
ncbi:hypothetical protein [Treponema zioleckii]|uniref:hypothetical protein n=1 Tax=Treponema zioleckii TaxID=331680 RepID=UPI00168BEC5F|nr:hypothetical protein [Treponema zioleckii]